MNELIQKLVAEFEDKFMWSDVVESGTARDKIIEYFFSALRTLATEQKKKAIEIVRAERLRINDRDYPATEEFIAGCNQTLDKVEEALEREL